MSDNDTDRALIRRVCRGDKGAADEFCRRFRPLIAGLAVNRFDFAPDEADDLVNQILLQLWEDDFKALRAWRGKARFSSYLGAIVIHACQRARQDAGRTRRLDQGDLLHLTDNAPGPTELIERGQWQERLELAIGSLSARDQLLLTLRYRHERTPADIARLLGMNTGTARKAVFDAIRRLRKCLARAESGYRHVEM